MSTAGASLRYQRALPSAMARTAARWGVASKGAKAASDVRPSTTIEVIARAASASAGAPGAQGVLPKAAAYQLNSMREVSRGYRPTTWPLHLAQSEPPAPTRDHHGVVANSKNRAGLRSDPAAIVGYFF